ncbi:PAS domain-containing protein [Limimaricola pyoseonensis]|uniref:PAS domain-containing protein n=1 Tax=Limimaricola pyoseonensis TaxID=521013 RepID=A0A1G7AB63_9RHOB|nr:PAS domain-containing protein [Limimaricola pyoseonensis]SDE11913.1 hypothetical protein SAMN04488567_0882 [Limimaricola pyoseonensis]
MNGSGISILGGPVGSAARDVPALVQLERYWRSLAGAGRRPARHDIDPARIEAVLPWAFLIEKQPGALRMRVAGRALSGWLGAEARGADFGDLFAPASRHRLAGCVATAFGAPALVACPVAIGRSPGHAPREGRLLLLPLRDAGGTQLLGALAIDGPAQAIPGGIHLGPAERIEPLRPARARSGRPELRLVVDNA